MLSHGNIRHTLNKIKIVSLQLDNIQYKLLNRNNQYGEIHFCTGCNPKKIIEKREWQESFQDYSEHTDYEAYTDYNDCHGDYYDYQ